MASKRHGTKTLEWHKHLRKRHGTKQAQEALVRQDGKRQCNEGVFDYVGPRSCGCCNKTATVVTGKFFYCSNHSFLAG